MSFQPKGFWMPQDAGRLAEENAGYEKSSKIESKRRNSWLIDTGEQEIFSNKKQAFQAVSDKPASSVSHMNISQWNTNLGFHSIAGQFSDRLVGPELVQTVNSVDKNMLSIGSGNLNMGMKDFGNQYSNDPSVGLSISHTIGGPSPSLNFGGIRKVKVNQVRDSDHCMSAASIGHPYSRSNNSIVSISAGYNENEANITMGPTYNNENDAIVTKARMSNTDNNFVAMGHILNRGDDSLMLMSHNYGKEDENILSVGQPFDRRDGNFISVGQSYEKKDDNLISLGTSCNKGYESFISMGGENFTNVARSYDKGINHLMSVGQTYDKVDSNIASAAIPPSLDTSNSSSITVEHNKCPNNIISFGGFHDDPEPNTSGGIINSYDLLMGNQKSSQGVDSQKDLTESNPEPLVNSTPKPNAEDDAVLKNKEPKTAKKAPTNNFPANVKSLLSTGIFDGVPVTYSTWSREKSLKGIIKGTGYLCSCDRCPEQKALNAYEFERHAGAKTKHPNNHIFFENGKTIYAVVQELKNTPQEMLFDAIQNVTGSTINQRNFRMWKASYQAATRELRRIYGADEVTISS